MTARRHVSLFLCGRFMTDRVFAVLLTATTIGLLGCGPRAPSGTPADTPAKPTMVPQVRGSLAQPAQHHDVSLPLKQIAPAPRPAGGNVEHAVKPIPRPPASQHPNTPVLDTVLQSTRAPTRKIPSALTSIDGIGNGFSGFTVNVAPPDTNGDVGLNHYVQTVNSDLVVFSKNGTVLYGPVALNTLWSGFGGGCQTNNDGDPVVLYDSISDRWVISQFSISTTPFLECVAVSQTNDPTGKYNRYSFSYTDFPDYPKLGVWPDAYYTTFNMFNAAGTVFKGAKICAYERSQMLAGNAATQQCFDTSSTIGGLLPADLDGARQPPVGAPNYAVALGSSANQLAFYKFHVDWSTPTNSTLTGPTNLATAAFSEACAGGTCIPQSGTTQKLDSLSDRLMFRLAYRNFGTYEAMVVSHSVTAGTSTGIRWYELRLNGGQPNIFQQSTYAPDSDYRWLPSIAMDQQGNMLLGFSVSGSTLNPQIHYTGRLASDATSQMAQGENSFINGSGSETAGLSRWGDYSMMSVDPADDRTFWFTSEYLSANGTFNWRTRIGSFKFSNPFDTRVFESGTTFAPEQDGTWIMADYDRDGVPDLVFIKTSNTGTGKVEVHIASGASKYQTRILETGTTFAPETDGTWTMADYDHDGLPDLIFIKTSNTGTGKVEIHIASGTSKYQTRILETGTTFAPETDGTWTMADYDHDGLPDLIFIKTSNTGTGKVEVHVASGASKYQTRIFEKGTTFAPETHGTWLLADYDGDQRPDLVFVKTSNTGTNKVEVHVASASSSYQTRVIETGTTFAPETDGDWLMNDWDRDGKLDLVFIKTSNTGTSRVEVHVASGS
jgi:hypothetical protein